MSASLLVDGENLLNLLIEHGIGVTAEQHTVYSLDEEWWGDVSEETENLLSVAKRAPRPEVIYPVKIKATARGRSYEAELINANGQVKFDGQLFGSPSGAGQMAANWKSCNGWTFWKYLNEESGIWRPIQEIRSYKTIG